MAMKNITSHIITGLASTVVAVVVSNWFINKGIDANNRKVVVDLARSMAPIYKDLGIEDINEKPETMGDVLADLFKMPLYNASDE